MPGELERFRTSRECFGRHKVCEGGRLRGKQSSGSAPTLPRFHRLPRAPSPAPAAQPLIPPCTASSPASVPVRRDTAASSGLSLSVPRLSAAPAHGSWHRRQYERGPAARPALPFPPWQGGCVGIRAHPLPGHQPQPPVIPEVWC